MKIQLVVPSELSEITLGQYQKFRDIVVKNPDNDRFVSDKAIEIFCKVPYEVVNSLKKKDYDFAIDTINKLITELNNEDIVNSKVKLINTFKLNGFEFGFMPDLDDATQGEFWDINKFLGDWDKMHNAMAVLFRPITKKKGGLYLIEEYETSFKYSEQMKEAPMNVVNAAMVFFYNLSNDLLSVIQVYLEEQLVKDIRNKKVLLQSGVDILQLKKSLAETILKLKMLLGLTSMLVLLSYPIKQKNLNY